MRTLKEEKSMDYGINRRKFLKAGAASVASLAAGPAILEKSVRASSNTLRIGVVGTGGRGRGLLGIMLSMPNLEFPALCDVNITNLQMAQDMVAKAGRPLPEGYAKGDEDFQRLMHRDDLDAVVIATPWHWHTPMAVCGMKAQKYVAVEVPAAISLDECWDLVNTHEETGVPCMMLENWSFRQDNLAVLNMIRLGMFGEMVHCHCAHSHDCIDHWFFDPEGNMRWGGRYLLKYNRDQYPTHSLGPVWGWLDLGYGDYYDTIVSTSTRSISINNYFRKKFGPDHPNAKREYKQGDIVTSMVKTKKGNTVIINYDMQLPRPYDNRWMIQGTEGIYNEQRNALYLHGQSPQYHQWEPFPPYQEKYDHAWWKEMQGEGGEQSHGGTDYLELKKFLEAVRNRTQTPITVYDSVLMSCIVPLSGMSIEQGGVPVKCPDFTRGRWKVNKPRFALDMGV